MLKRIEYKFKSYYNSIADVYYYMNTQSSFTEHKYTNASKIYNQISDYPYSPALLRSFNYIE